MTTGEQIAFAKEGLEQAVETIKTKYIPSPVEHLSYLPPIGRVVDATLVEHDGDYWLAIREEALAPGHTPDLLLPEVSTTAGHEEPGFSLQVTLSTEPRNFEAADFEDIRSAAPRELGEVALHSDLPPLIWSFSIVLGSLGFVGAKSFVSEFYKQLGAATAKDFLDWLGSASKKAKEGDREQLAEFRFLLAGGVAVMAFCPFSPDMADSVDQLEKALNRIADVATFVGEVEAGRTPAELRQIAFIWDESAWHLAWWSSDEASYVTQWLRDNAPDPSRFLGSAPPTLRLLEPYLPELPGASAPDGVPDVEIKVARSFGGSPKDDRGRQESS